MMEAWGNSAPSKDAKSRLRMFVGTAPCTIREFARPEIQVVPHRDTAPHKNVNTQAAVVRREFMGTAICTQGGSRFTEGPIFLPGKREENHALFLSAENFRTCMDTATPMLTGSRNMATLMLREKSGSGEKVSSTTVATRCSSAEESTLPNIAKSWKTSWDGNYSHMNPSIIAMELGTTTGLRIWKYGVANTPQALVSKTNYFGHWKSSTCMEV